MLEIFAPKGLYFLFFHKISLFLGDYLKKSFFRSIFNAVFNIVKINFSSQFLHGTPYSTADFSPREFQANRSVTVKVLSLLVLFRNTEKSMICEIHHKPIVMHQTGLCFMCTMQCLVLNNSAVLIET